MIFVVEDQRQNIEYDASTNYDKKGYNNIEILLHMVLILIEIKSQIKHFLIYKN